MQIDVFVASVSYWAALTVFLLLVNRRLSRLNSKLSEIEQRVGKGQVEPAQ